MLSVLLDFPPEEVLELILVEIETSTTLPVLSSITIVVYLVPELDVFDVDEVSLESLALVLVELSLLDFVEC